MTIDIFLILTWTNSSNKLPKRSLVERATRITFQEKKKYVSKFGLNAYDARVISDEINMANFFEETVANGADAKLASNWVTSDIVLFKSK